MPPSEFWGTSSDGYVDGLISTIFNLFIAFELCASTQCTIKNLNTIKRHYKKNSRKNSHIWSACHWPLARWRVPGPSSPRCHALSEPFPTWAAWSSPPAQRWTSPMSAPCPGSSPAGRSGPAWSPCRWPRHWGRWRRGWSPACWGHCPLRWSATETACWRRPEAWSGCCVHCPLQKCWRRTADVPSDSAQRPWCLQYKIQIKVKSVLSRFKERETQ